MMHAAGTAAPKGTIGLTVIRGDGRTEHPSAHGNPAHIGPPMPEKGFPTLADIRKYAMPNKECSDVVNEWRRRNQEYFWPYALKVLTMQRLAKVLGHGGVPVGAAWLKVLRGDGSVEDLGLASVATVTTAGVNKIVSVLNTTDATTGVNFKYHAFGTSTTASASTDTALVTEETTQYVTDNTRPTGSQTVGGSSNVYRSVGTYSPDSGTSPRPITEWGLLSQAATGGGTLLDRIVFSVVNLVTLSDSLQVTFDLTLPAGG
jgi:hypothetical protein